MQDFVMRNFHNFLLEKISYDLKLELLEELDPKEALELMKVNKEFRSWYLKDPWRIFGRHVNSIDFMENIKLHPYRIKICKFPQSAPVRCDLRRHLPLLQKIKSCVQFKYQRDCLKEETIEAARRILSNLGLIVHLDSWVRDLKCFSKFQGQITDYISMNLGLLTWCSWEENDRGVLTKFLETQLFRCKHVNLSCFVEHFSTFYKSFSKTNIERLDFSLHASENSSAVDLKTVFSSIVSNGIPSQNRDAQISIGWYRTDSPYDPVDNLLLALPGIERLPDKRYGIEQYRYYRRKIDDERDCIYLLVGINGDSPFYAKYVPSQPQGRDTDDLPMLYFQM